MNCDTHLYLYAKGHYEKNDMINDLKIIVAERSGIECKYITKRDISSILLSAVNQLSQLGVYDLFNFVGSLDPQNNWEHGGSSDEDFDTRVIRSSLSVLRFTEVRHIPDLGVADPNILPLNP